MSKENFDWQRMNADEMPGDIPSPDEGWNEMRYRLDEEMPAAGIVMPIKTGRFSFVKNRLLIGAAALLLLLFSAWLFSSQRKLTQAVGDSAINATGNDSPVKEKKDIPPVKGNEKSGNATTGDLQNRVESNETNPGENVAGERSNDQYGGQTDATQEALKKSPKLNLPRLNKMQNTPNGGLTYLKRKNQSKKQRNRDTTSHVEQTLTNIEEKMDAGGGNEIVQTEEVVASSVATIRNDTTNNVAVKKTSDTLMVEQANPGIGESDNIIVTGGMQWNIQTPAAHAANYFSGPRGKSEPYRVLIPGIWVNVQLETNLLSLEINPFYSQQLPGKSFVTSTSTKASGDTIIFINETKTVNRVFGTGINIGYAKNIIRSWWAGGGMEANWWRNAAVQSEINEEKRLSGNAAVIATNAYSQSGKIETRDWARLTKFQVKITGEIFYRKKQLAAGIRFGYPVMPFSDSKGPQHPVDARLVVQLPLVKYSAERHQ